MYNIEFYQDKNGKSEILEYIGKLKKSNSKNSKIKLNKIISYSRFLKNNGINLNTSYIKHLDDEILFAHLYNNKFILLSIFTKRTQKTPKREIEKAKRLLEDYKKRESDIK